ncbi:MAG: methyltransferase domain-containing protein [Patescibacteria group bacterium]
MSLAYNISAFNRRRKYRKFLDLLRPQARTTILDVGFTEIEYSASDNFLEKNYPWPDKITALGLNEAKEFSKRYPQVKAVAYDGRRFPFPDRSFDIVWSNAVLEHVGSREDQIFFLQEIKRVGRQAFITTPNRMFPIEIHTRTPLLHFLPKRLFDAYLKLVGKGWAAGDYMNLLSRRELERCLQAAGIKNYRIIKNRLLGFVLDLVAVII